MTMAAMPPLKGVVREVRHLAIVALAAFVLVCALWLWLAGLDVLPSVIRNSGYGLVLSVLITVTASSFSSLAILLVRRRPLWQRALGYSAALVLAAVVGTYGTALLFFLLGTFPWPAVAINFGQNIEAMVLVTLFVGGLILGAREWRDSVEAARQAAESARRDRPRVPSRVGGKVEFVDLAAVSYVYAQDKLTFAVTPAKHHPLDLSIAELEQKVASGDWLRIHRSTLVNVHAVKGLFTDVEGRLFVRLADGAELRVAKERAAQVRAALKG